MYFRLSFSWKLRSKKVREAENRFACVFFLEKSPQRIMNRLISRKVAIEFKHFMFHFNI